LASCTQIDHQIQSYLDGELAHSDRAILDQHLAECPGCVELLRKQQRSHATLFEAYTPARLRRDLSEYVVSHLPEMESLSAEMASLNERTKHPTPLRERAYRLMPIAAAVLLVVLAALIKARWPVSGVPADTVGLVAVAEGSVHRIDGDTGARSRARERVWAGRGDRFETSADARASVLMLGPSELRMAADTTVVIDDERKITIEKGRVFLDVGRGQGQFKLATPTGEVTVFGTRFDVMVEAQRTTVIVEEGEVQLSHHDNPLLFRMIKRDQRAYVEYGRDNVPVDAVDARIECAWAKSVEAGAPVRTFFAERLQPSHETQQVSGEGGYFLQTNGKSLQSLLVTWAETSPLVRYGDFDVFVYAPDNTAVFRGHIPGSTFSDPRLHEIEIPNTGDTHSGYLTVFVKLVPLGGPESGRADIQSVSGRIGKEGR
jgi:ferric-dicitrate binding protein FerR (iron transport regulator)